MCCPVRALRRFGRTAMRARHPSSPLIRGAALPQSSARWQAGAKPDGTLGLGFVDVPFAIENIRCENGEAEAHTRIGWFRSVSNIPHAFAMQSFVAEMAHAAGRDPKDFLLELIGEPRIVDPRKSVETFWNYGDPFDTFPIDTGRLRKVIELAAEKAEWGRKLPKGRGLGIAAHRSFLTYVA